MLSSNAHAKPLTLAHASAFNMGAQAGLLADTAQVFVNLQRFPLVF